MGRERWWTARLAMIRLAMIATGCAVKFAKRSPWDMQQIQALSEQLDQFRSLAQLKAEEADQLRSAKSQLESRLSSEIDQNQVSVGFDERGLVVRVLDKVLFDSGKAKLRHEATPVLDKVARVLNEQGMNQPVGIEGHTDNQPIKHSGWKDNYELSLARAQSVVQFLEKRGLDPSRAVPVGHGDEKPIASNDTPEGRRMNRRVEIVLLPKGAAQSGPRGSSGEVFTK